MERPYYETKEDLVKESQSVIYIENYSGQKLFKLPIKYGADCIGIDKYDKPKALWEIKNRNVSRTTYKTYMISLAKFTIAMQYADIMNIPFMLYVEWTNPLERGILQCTNNLLKYIHLQKKNYREDIGDIEPCVYIPIELFNLI